MAEDDLNNVPTIVIPDGGSVTAACPSARGNEASMVRNASKPGELLIGCKARPSGSEDPKAWQVLARTNFVCHSGQDPDPGKLNKTPGGTPMITVSCAAPKP